MSTDSPTLRRGRTKRSRRRWLKAWRIVNKERSQLLEDAGLC